MKCFSLVFVVLGAMLTAGCVGTSIGTKTQDDRKAVFETLAKYTDLRIGEPAPSEMKDVLAPISIFTKCGPCYPTRPSSSSGKNMAIGVVFYSEPVASIENTFPVVKAEVARLFSLTDKGAKRNMFAEFEDKGGLSFAIYYEEASRRIRFHIEDVSAESSAAYWVKDRTFETYAYESLQGP